MWINGAAVSSKDLGDELRSKSPGARCPFAPITYGRLYLSMLHIGRAPFIEYSPSGRILGVWWGAVTSCEMF